MLNYYTNDAYYILLLYIMKIIIKKKPIPYNYERNLLKYLIYPGHYNFLSKSEENILKKKIIKYNELYDLDININLLYSIRSAYMSEKMMINNHKLIRKSKFLFEKYNNGMNILQISQKYDFAPILILKQILYKLKFSKKNVKDIFYSYIQNNLEEVKKKYKYDDRLIQQIPLAIENDKFNRIDQTEIIKNSENFEIILGKYLTSKGISFKTQEMLVKEQIKLHGRPVSTPDFLLESELIINNKIIKWIDAKNFYGANTKIIRKSIKKQTKKYIDNYGFGCIVFSMNFSDKLNFENVMLIDFTELK
jgi:hypothetical protein